MNNVAALCVASIFACPTFAISKDDGARDPGGTVAPVWNTNSSLHQNQRRHAVGQ